MGFSVQFHNSTEQYKAASLHCVTLIEQSEAT